MHRLLRFAHLRRVRRLRFRRSALVILHDALLLHHAHGVVGRLDAGAVVARPDLRELRPGEQDERRVIQPHEDDHHRARRPERIAGIRAAEVEADQELADDEQKRRRERAHPDVAPHHVGVGEHAEDGGEEEREDAEADDDLADPRERRPDRPDRCLDLREEAREERARRQRDDEQQGDHEHHPEREHPLRQE